MGIKFIDRRSSFIVSYADMASFALIKAYTKPPFKLSLNSYSYSILVQYTVITTYFAFLHPTLQ